jgi:hypothetical protein
MAVSWAISDCFGVPTQFLGPVTLGTQFERWHYKLVDFAFYGRFAGYSKLLGGPDVISRAGDTRYTI